MLSWPVKNCLDQQLNNYNSHYEPQFKFSIRRCVNAGNSIINNTLFDLGSILDCNVTQVFNITLSLINTEQYMIVEFERELVNIKAGVMNVPYVNVEEKL